MAWNGRVLSKSRSRSNDPHPKPCSLRWAGTGWRRPRPDATGAPAAEVNFPPHLMLGKFNTFNTFNAFNRVAPANAPHPEAPAFRLPSPAWAGVPAGPCWG